MPYIINERRIILDDVMFDLALNVESTGDLNYVITKLIKDILDLDKVNERAINYDSYNSMIGVLECAKLELYRRMVAPYEDKKKKENGDVY